MSVPMFVFGFVGGWVLGLLIIWIIWLCTPYGE